MNKTPILCFVFDRKKTGTIKKEAPLELRVTYEKKQKYLATGIRLLPRQWSHGMIKNRPDTDALKLIMDNLLKEVREVIAEMQERGEIDIFSIGERLELKRKNNISFIDFAEERMKIRKFGKAEDSQERYERFMRFFKSWGKISQFQDINEAKIIEMDQELDMKGMKPYSKWNNYHRFLNSFILDAIEEGYIKKNPYKKLKIEKDKSSGGIGKYLTPEEFERIKNVKPNIQSMERVRDVFVFQTYTCLSYVDLAAFDATKIEEVKGRKIYTGRRGKTNQQFMFLILEPAQKILDKYNGKLPVISNVKYNEYLKALAVMAGIDKPLSSHWARHTGATLLLNEGEVNMEVVAKVLGHSSAKITRKVYAKLLDDTVVDAMANFESKM